MSFVSREKKKQNTLTTQNGGKYEKKSRQKTKEEKNETQIFKKGEIIHEETKRDIFSPLSTRKKEWKRQNNNNNIKIADGARSPFTEAPVMTFLVIKDMLYIIQNCSWG